jgi:DegV family protein with EDD domain
MSIRIVTDSTCDLPEQVVEEHGITVVPLYINIGQDSYLDGVELSRQKFYQNLPNYGVFPTTSVPGPAAFVRAYEKLATEGATEILSIHISETLSNVVNSARLGAEELPHLSVTPFDSGQLSLGVGIQAIAAAKAAAAGKPMREIVALLESMSARSLTMAALDTLEFLRRSGRLTRFQSILGSLLSLKPIIKMQAGEMDMERIRTRRWAIERMIQTVEELGPLEELAVVHTGAPESAEELYEQARHLFPKQERPQFGEVTPVIGAHIGPGAVGFVALTSG